MHWFQKTTAVCSLLLAVATAGLPASASTKNWQERLNFEQVSPVLYRGKEPKEQDYERLAQAGIKTIVNLRLSPHSARRSLERSRQYGMNHFHLPIGFFRRPYKEVEQFVHIVSDQQNQPAYVFCQGGRDRAGFMVMAYRVKVEDCDYEKAYSEMREHRFRRWLITLWRTAKDLKEEPALVHRSDHASIASKRE